jgi:hypothetical protein
MSVKSLYQSLFGRENPSNGSVIDLAEHGRVGGVSTGQPFKFTADVGGLSVPLHDYIATTYPTDSSEVYTFKTGGSGGTTVATITITYTDDTKENLLTVERS